MVSLARARKMKHCLANYSFCLANYVIKKCNNDSHLNVTTVSHARHTLNTYIQQSLPLGFLLDICIKRQKLSDHQYVLHESYVEVHVCSICSL